MTRRELRKHLARDARKWVNEVWKAASETAAQLDNLSPVTAPLGIRLVDSYAAREEASEEAQRGFRIALVAGYASRAVLVDPTEQPTVRPSAFGLTARPDVERLGADTAAIKRLADPVRKLATEEFDTVMTLPKEVWSGYVATAAHKLQRQLQDTVTWRDLGRDEIERMLRYGYALRCLDEAIDAEPVIRDPDAEPAEADEGQAPAGHASSATANGAEPAGAAEPAGTAEPVPADE